MIYRYFLAVAAILFSGAVAAFATVAFAGAAVAFAPPPAPAAVAGPATPPAAGAPDAAGMRAKLRDMDTDHDGRWSKAEWIAGGRREAGFDRMDTNHDGYLTPEELRAGMAAMRAHRTEDMPLPPAAVEGTLPKAP